MRIDIPEGVYADIAELIRSDESPVGIDAKKTHVIIIEKLMAIERRLLAIERRLDGQPDLAHPDLG